MEREGTVTISFITFGRHHQAEQSALQMVRDLQIRQHHIIHAAYNGKELPIDSKWSEPVITDEPAEPVQ